MNERSRKSLQRARWHCRGALRCLVLLSLALLLPVGAAVATGLPPGAPAALEDPAVPPLYREALQAYVDGAAAYRRGDYARAAQRLSDFWARHPAGSAEWKLLRQDAAPLRFQADFGSPPVYSALRMLTECAQWRLQAGAATAKTTAQLTVVLVGESQGVAPATPAELRNGQGRPEVHRLAPEFEGDGAKQVLDDSYWLFDDYVLALTRGELGLHRVIVRLPDFRVALDVQPGRVRLSRPETERVFAAVPADVARATRWWHIVYPSQVPTADAFRGVRFVTGGLRSGPAGSAAPCFLSEDLKHLRAANQDGRHRLTPLEREVALPQWLQHEFFHHLFALYPDAALEARSHQWFDRSAWPADFEGFGEADYFAEAAHKRLQPHAPPTLAQRLLQAKAARASGADPE